MNDFENNISNLFETYRTCGEYKKSLSKKENFESVFIKNNYWPEYSFNLNPNIFSEIESIKDQIIKHKISNNFLVFSNNIYLKDLFDKNNYKAKDIWYIMNLKKYNSFITDKNDSSNIKIKLLKKNELFLWNDYIGLDHGFVEFLYDNRFHFYVLMVDDLVISTSLFYVTNNIANIYMVGTKKEYRKKGYASILMKNNINNYIKNNFQDYLAYSSG